MTDSIICRNPLTYEEILNWLGFSFETSREFERRAITIADVATILEDGEYGIAEANRIMDTVASKAAFRAKTIVDFYNDVDGNEIR